MIPAVTQVRKFEEVSNNAWPALQTLLYDGWVIRFANGVTKRSNSVNPLYASTLGTEKKIKICEALFSREKIPPTFKITAFSNPGDLDLKLGLMGYAIHATVSFQVCDLKPFSGQSHPAIQSSAEDDESWHDDFIRMNGFDPARKPTYKQILRMIRSDKHLIRAVCDGKTIGVGLGVLEKPYLGIFDIVIDPAYRKLGFGKHVTGNLMHWGKNHGAKIAYLQVLSDNYPALNLYRTLGFRELYPYWYRMKSL